MIKVTHFPGYVREGKPFKQETFIYNIDDIHHLKPGWGLWNIVITSIIFSSGKETIEVTETPEEINNLILEARKPKNTDKTVLHHRV